MMGGRELQWERGSKAGLPGRRLGPARHRRSQGNRGEVLKEEMCAEGKQQRCPNQTANSMNCLRLGFSFHCWNTNPRSDTWSPGLLYGGQGQFREGMRTSLASNLGWLLQKSLGFPHFCSPGWDESPPCDLPWARELSRPFLRARGQRAVGAQQKAFKTSALLPGDTQAGRDGPQDLIFSTHLIRKLLPIETSLLIVKPWASWLIWTWEAFRVLPRDTHQVAWQEGGLMKITSNEV